MARTSSPELAAPAGASMAELAEAIRNDALALAYREVPPAAAGGELEQLLLRPEFLRRLQDGLGRSIAQVLAANDARVQAVYSYDPSADPCAEPGGAQPGGQRPAEATLHLLVRVTQPTAGLRAFIDALDRALTLSLHQLPLGSFAVRGSVLDAILVSEDEVRQRSGWGALVASAAVPPLRLWAREP
jgi:hypothetical protein